MTNVYLRPQDVGLGHAQKVLGFLNAVETAEAFARAVGILGELDVGVRVAQRILDRRQELGGFSHLQQLVEVPLVGPERFTEIVLTLSGASAPQSMKGGVQTTVTGLLEEITRMREELNSLQAIVGAQEKLSLRALQIQPFLGQPTNLIATVGSSDRATPRRATRITMTTTWGRLRNTSGRDSQEGSSITIRTGADASAKVLLLPPTSEQLPDIHQSILELALQSLNPNATTPRGTEEGLRELAHQYKLEANQQLRNAMDIYFRDFGKPLFETVNAQDYLYSWPIIEATIFAYVADDVDDAEGQTAVKATALLPLKIKNWLGAWLQTYLTQSKAGSTLESDFNDVGIYGGDFGVVINRFHTQISNYLNNQRGLVGEYIGQKLTQTSIRNFLNTNLGKLSREVQVELSPVLDVTSRTLASAGTSVLASFGQARENLRKEIATNVSRIENDGLGPLASQMDGLTTKVGTLDVRVGTVATRVTAVDTKVGKLDTRVGAVDTRVTAVDTKIGKLDTRVGRVDDRFTVVDNRVGTLDRQVNKKIDTKVSATQLTALETNLNKSLRTKATTTQLKTLETNLNKSLRTKASTTQLKQLETGINRQFRTIGQTPNPESGTAHRQ